MLAYFPSFSWYVDGKAVKERSFAISKWITSVSDVKFFLETTASTDLPFRDTREYPVRLRSNLPYVSYFFYGTYDRLLGSLDVGFLTQVVHPRTKRSMRKGSGGSEVMPFEFVGDQGTHYDHTPTAARFDYVETIHKNTGVAKLVRPGSPDETFVLEYVKNVYAVMENGIFRILESFCEMVKASKLAYEKAATQSEKRSVVDRFVKESSIMRDEFDVESRRVYLIQKNTFAAGVSGSK
jgi:hypothetical protein